MNNVSATTRLDKYLANYGVCARRDVKQLLKKDYVTVNGQRVRESGVRVDIHQDTVLINGNPLQKPKFVYYMINKPKGVVSTTDDEFGRKNVTALVPAGQRVYPVGRLDKETTGLLLLSNDGELTNLLTHPRYHVFKIYRLTIQGKISQPQLSALRKGVLLEDGITSPATVRIIKEKPHISLLEVTLHEGKNRQIRRMCETVGVKLLELKRIKIGPLELGLLKEGQYRELTRAEVALLRQITNIKTQEKNHKETV